MNAFSLSTIIKMQWPDVNFVCADRDYSDGIDDEDVRKYWHKWKFGFLGFGGQPLYKNESQDCDDLVRHFIVKFRRNNKVKNHALPIFYTGWKGHAYCSYINQYQDVKSMDLRDGKLYEIESFVVEMV